MTRDERHELEHLLYLLNQDGAGGDGLDVDYDRLCDLAEEAAADLKGISAVFSAADEFGHPVNPEASLPATSQRVFNVLAEIAETRRMLHSAVHEMDGLMEELDYSQTMKLARLREYREFLDPTEGD